MADNKENKDKSKTILPYLLAYPFIMKKDPKSDLIKKGIGSIVGKPLQTALDKFNEGKDPKNQIHMLDVADVPNLVRKLPIGPSIEELQDSKMDELLLNKKRPASHVAKDAAAFIGGNIAQEVAGAAIGAGIKGVKGKKAISKYTDDILNTAIDTSKKHPFYTKAERRASNKTTEDMLKNYSTILNNVDDAKKIASNYDEQLKYLVNRKNTFENFIESNKNNIEKFSKFLEDPKFKYIDEVIEKAKANEALSDKELSILREYTSYLDKVDVEKSHLDDFSKQLEDVNRKIDNFPTDSELAKQGLDLHIKSRDRLKSLIRDWLNGASIEDLRARQGVEGTSYKPTYKNEANAIKNASYELTHNQDEFINFLAAFGDTKRGREFLEESMKNQKVFELFMSNKGDEYLKKLGKNATKDDIINYGTKLLDAWDSIGVPMLDAKAKNTESAVSKQISKMIQDKHDITNDELNKMYQLKTILGDSKLRKLQIRRTSKKLLSNLKSNEKYLKTYDKLVNPTDPIQKALEKGKGTSAYKNILSDRMKAGNLSLNEAIQDIALENALDELDIDALSRISAVVDYNVPIEVVDDYLWGEATRKVGASPIREYGGKIKSIDDIIPVLTESPTYKQTIERFAKELTGDAKAFTKAGAIEGASVPLLVNWTKRSIENGKNNAYDPFNKKTGDDLPPNMKPWDPELERSTGDKLANNALSFFGANFDRGPERFSDKQINALRDAFEYANNIKHWKNPHQVEGWSDGEIIDRAIEIGKGKHPEIASLVREKYIELMEKETK